MPASHGSKAVLKLGNPTTLQDLSTYFSSVSAPNLDIETAEVTTLGATAKSYVAGLEDGTISAEGPFHPTVDAQVATMRGGVTVAWEYGPQGTTTGLPKYTGNAFLTSYGPETPVDDAATFSLELQITGAVTRSVY